MIVKNQPATPLPWVSREQGDADSYALLTADRQRWVVAFRLNGEQSLDTERRNVAYLVHAAHAYEALVRMVHDLYPLAKVGTVELGQGNDVLGRARKLMNDLAEEQP